MTGSDGPPYVVVSSWDSAALVDARSTVVFGTETTNEQLEIYDPDYRPDPAGVGSRRQTLLNVMRKMSEFSR